jgi:hypothetical protein
MSCGTPTRSTSCPTRDACSPRSRALRPGGRYRLSCANPFVHGIIETSWTGRGYELRLPYVDGAEVPYDDPCWEFTDGAGAEHRVEGPHEFRHAMSTLINGLIGRGLRILGLFEDAEPAAGEAGVAAGTWEHLQTVAPPYLVIWAEKEGA